MKTARRIGAFFRSVGAVAIVFATTAAAAKSPEPPAKKPKLLVILAVDQMRADYVATYGGAWHEGLDRLLRGGVVFDGARYPYLDTITCAGHSTIGTGAYPHRHGMVLNAWWGRDRGRGVECTEDPDAPLVAYGAGKPMGGGQSGRNIKVPTFAQVLRDAEATADPKPHVVSFSAKARSAIGLAGAGGDVVAWFDGKEFVTSRAFSAAPIPVVEKTLAAHPAKALVANPWLKFAPPAAYRFADDAPAEHPSMPFWTRVFPHALALPIAGRPETASLPPLVAWSASALPDELLADLAKNAVIELKLGQRATTDFLAVSFSQLDIVGHAFGPRSHEVQDVLLRLDRLLGDLLNTLDQTVGKDNYLVALTADHGVSEIPEQLTAEHKDAGRVPKQDLLAKLEFALAAEIGPGPHVDNITYTQIYLKPPSWQELRAKPGAVDRVCAVVKKVPGILACFSADELVDPAKTHDPVARAAALSYFPGRSGDLVTAPRAHWLNDALAGTTHGSQNDYDQRVPLVFYGSGLRGRHVGGAASPADIAPTFAAVMGLPLPDAEGRARSEVVAPLQAARNIHR